ncbi:TldD/PmbA family protein [Carboxydothermus pertinax]|uniref:Uncharacterized protein n=1 Tax=Carboxydothermus pertinax TaxID=870242 RepID=A0A1L8CTZ0_9THEO|nr:TldD/PmbA family protein [Carboxydothermus pertinax]GAV22386.1 hypothetical protein cpu_08960 [Carboxydothermus pertinax]
MEVLELALQEILARKATGEVCFTRGEELSIEVREGKVETVKQAVEEGIGVRVFVDGRLGFAYTTQKTPEKVVETVQKAVAAAKLTDPDPFYVLAGNFTFEPLELSDPNITNTPLEEKVTLALTMEREALNFSPQIKGVETAAYDDYHYQLYLANTKGFWGSFSGNYASSYIYLASEDEAGSETAFAYKVTRKFKEIDPVALGREAAEKAVAKLGAGKIPSGRYQALLDPYVAINLLGVLKASFLAENVQKGKSLLKGKLGEKLFSPAFSLIDDGTLKAGLATAPFDGEGVPTQKTILVENGTVKSYLYNLYTATKDGVRSTGNAVRSSFKALPELGTTNFYIPKGGFNRESLFKQTSRGVFITEVLGMHTANPVSGDFSVGASGFLVENGEITRPVRGITIAGNIKELFQKLVAAGDDLRFYGAKGSPTLLIEEVAVSGS